MTLVEVCGLSRLGDVAAVNLAQPDFIGFYFSAGPAQISAADAKELRRILDPQIVTVGIFSQTSASEVANLINQGIIQMAQFMGEVSAEFLEEVRRGIQIHGYGYCGQLIVCLPVTGDAQQVSAALQAGEQSSADYVLFQVTDPAFRWSWLRGFTRPFFLGGLIDRHNILDALDTGSMALCCSADIQESGRIDGEQVRDLMRAVRILSS